MPKTKLYNKQDIITKSMDLFWRYGFAGTSLNALEKVTGVNKSGLYTEFKNKDDLFHQVVKAHFSICSEKIDNMLNKKPLGLSNIKRFLIYSPTLIKNRGCFFTVSKRDRNQIPRSSIEKVNKHYENIRLLFVKNLKASKVKNTRSELASQILLSFSQGICLRAFNGEDIGNLNRQAELLVDILSAQS